MDVPSRSDASPEITRTLSRLTAYKNVRGVLVLSRANAFAVIESQGKIFEGDKGKKYGKLVGQMVENMRQTLDELEEGDDLKLMRLRTKKHELIVTPDEKYLLVVLQDPA